MAHLLLDENLPRLLLRHLAPHSGSTVQQMRWDGTKNGRLLQRAAEEFDALITMDGNLRYQQNLKSFDIGVILLQAPTNRPDHVLPLAPKIVEAAYEIAPGTLVVVS